MKRLLEKVIDPTYPDIIQATDRQIADTIRNHLSLVVYLGLVFSQFAQQAGEARDIFRAHIRRLRFQNTEQSLREIAARVRWVERLLTETAEIKYRFLMHIDPINALFLNQPRNVRNDRMFCFSSARSSAAICWHAGHSR